MENKVMKDKVKSNAEVINSLPLFERSSQNERAPFYKKWHALRIKGFEDVGGGFLRIIPHPDTGLTVEDFDKVIDMNDKNVNIPPAVIFNGGWLIFTGLFISSFWTNESFNQKHRPVNGIEVEITKVVTTFIVTKIYTNMRQELFEHNNGWRPVRKGDSEEGRRNIKYYLIEAGGTTWPMEKYVFEKLQPVVGDWLLVEGDKDYDIIHVTVDESEEKEKEMETTQRLIEELSVETSVSITTEAVSGE